MSRAAEQYRIGETFNGEKFRGLLAFTAPKDATPPNFAEKAFVNSHKTVKFMKVFSLEIFLLYGIHVTQGNSWSHKPHPLQREEGVGHTATIELSSQQKLDVANQIRILRRLSWSTITSRVQLMSASYYLTAMFDNCIPR